MCYFKPVSQNKWEDYIQKSADYLKNNLITYQKNGYIIGLSGGIDSAVSVALAVNCIGANRVKCLILPDQDSSSDTVDDALRIAQHLGIKDVKVEDITEKLSAFGTYSLFEDFYKLPKNQRIDYVRNQKLSDAMEGIDFKSRKIQALWTSKIRMRMMILHLNAEINNLMVLGTTNKTEYMLGWFTKYGDNAVDIEILINLYKTRIFQLAKILNLPQFIIDKEPSADIICGIGGKSLGVSSETLDYIISQLENAIHAEDVAKKINVSLTVVQKIQKLIYDSEIKRKAPLIFEETV